MVDLKGQNRSGSGERVEKSPMGRVSGFDSRRVKNKVTHKAVNGSQGVPTRARML